MADPRAFISFDFDNNLMDKYLFVGQTKRPRGACAGRRQPLVLCQCTILISLTGECDEDQR